MVVQPVFALTFTGPNVVASNLLYQVTPDFNCSIIAIAKLLHIWSCCEGFMPSKQSSGESCTSSFGRGLKARIEGINVKYLL